MTEPSPSQQGTPHRTLRLGRQLIEDHIGWVYEATLTKAAGEEPVSVRLLDLSTYRKAGRKGLKLDLAKLAKVDDHQLVKVLGLLEFEGRLGIMSGPIQGERFDTLLEEGLPARALFEVLGQVARAVRAGSEAPVDGLPLRVAHRDIHPGVIRVGKHGVAQLLDFGLARRRGFAADVLAGKVVPGAPLTVPPECFDDQKASLRSDIFALGAVLYRAISGRELIKSTTLQVIYKDPNPGAAWARHLDKCMEKIPDQPDSVKALARASLSFDPVKRPGPAAFEEQCSAIASEVGGLSLALWCRERTWGAPRGAAGAWTDRVIDLGEDPDAPKPKVPVPSQAVTAADAVPPRAVPSSPPRRASASPTAMYAVSGSIASLMLLVGLGMGAIVMAALWFLSGSVETPPPEPEPRLDIEAPAPVEEPEPEVEEEPEEDEEAEEPEEEVPADAEPAPRPRKPAPTPVAEEAEVSDAEPEPEPEPPPPPPPEPEAEPEEEEDDKKRRRRRKKD